MPPTDSALFASISALEVQSRHPSTFDVSPSSGGTNLPIFMGPDEVPHSALQRCLRPAQLGLQSLRSTASLRL